MKKYLGIILTLSVFNNACAHQLNSRQAASDSTPLTSEAKMISLENYDKDIAVFRVEVCPADAKIDTDVKFSPSGDPSLVYAELSFRVPKEECYANTSQQVKIDISSEIKTAASKKGIKASYILMKSIPHRIEVNQQ